MNWSIYYPIDRDNQWYVATNENITAREVIQKALGNTLTY